MTEHQLVKKERLLELKYFSVNNTTQISKVLFSGYMLFNETATNKRFVLLDCINHSEEPIEEINFEILEINEKKEVFNKRTYCYETLILEEETRFKMINKFEVHQSCSEVEVNIIEVTTMSKSGVGGDSNKIGTDTSIIDLTNNFEITKASELKYWYSIRLGIVFITLFVILVYLYRYILTR